MSIRSVRSLSLSTPTIEGAGGKPLEEPVAWYGPIVMNTQAEIEQAVAQLRDLDERSALLGPAEVVAGSWGALRLPRERVRQLLEEEEGLLDG